MRPYQLIGRLSVRQMALGGWKRRREANISAFYGVDRILMPYIQDKIISE